MQNYKLSPIIFEDASTIEAQQILDIETFPLNKKIERAASSPPKPISEIFLGNALDFYSKWSRPTVIISDGPYGLKSFPGDPPTPKDLSEWYAPHLQAWYERALPSATLWFWNSELGWANCHQAIEDAGWEFRNCHIWDKGMAHVAGNCNTKTMRKYPVVTEVCAQYVRKNKLKSDGKPLLLREWLRAEWRRSGLPFSHANLACGVKDAATRKYFSKDHLWYFPPAEALVQLATYANKYGLPTEKPYFSDDAGRPFTPRRWELMRAKFFCKVGISNVWHEPAVRGRERIKHGTASLHMNQKPLSLLARIITASSEMGDVIWEPFGGLCSASYAAIRLGRTAFASEINEHYFHLAKERFKNAEKEQ